jgi:hypothetical protein
MAILKQLDLFWLHADCPERFKIHALNAVIRSKLLYGLDTAALTGEMLKDLDTFQLKGLRKIFNITTTAGQTIQGLQRTNNNNKVYSKTVKALNTRENGKPPKRKVKNIETYSETYKRFCMNQYEEMLTTPETDPVKRANFFPPTLMPRVYAKFRPGVPKLHWPLECIKEYWKIIVTKAPEN